jgi:hypothetical protein
MGMPGEKSPGFPHVQRGFTMLDAFDLAVIEYANTIGVESEHVYLWCNKFRRNYRETYTQAQLIAALDRIKAEVFDRGF